MTTVVPFFRSPFTDLTRDLVNHQLYGRCEEMEMRVMNCLEAYGADRGMKKCKDLIDDFQECSTRKKQMLRVAAMKEERERQYKAGERSKQDRYAEAPRIDAY
ncbi:NADH dehydrogenase [ubiquinone] iron-sulfur protein 5 [Periplaneta americana]|uniref:NADH dehydrogenase [ubiquinone] iron-sulfur protein 5 n=1 Tax=Periplaneta americana TaxID=6978 RepID=UPI0037E8AB60